MIDTPVARISDNQREKFAEVLNDVGVNKQVLLLFTPSEYSEEISQIMDNSIDRIKITLSDEKQSKDGTIMIEKQPDRLYIENNDRQLYEELEKEILRILI